MFTFKQGGIIKMPGMNGSGPLGTGPMTGRGGGYCMAPVSPEAGFIPGFGRGGGRGRRNCINAVGSPWLAGMNQGSSPAAVGEQELNQLRAQLGKLEDALQEAKKRIQELEAGN
jgi:hypothetical protein